MKSMVRKEEWQFASSVNEFKALLAMEFACIFEIYAFLAYIAHYKAIETITIVYFS